MKFKKTLGALLLSLTISAGILGNTIVTKAADTQSTSEVNIKSTNTITVNYVGDPDPF
jgi:hypothetical protein